MTSLTQFDVTQIFGVSFLKFTFPIIKKQFLDKVINANVLNWTKVFISVHVVLLSDKNSDVKQFQGVLQNYSIL